MAGITIGNGSTWASPAAGRRPLSPGRRLYRADPGVGCLSRPSASGATDLGTPGAGASLSGRGGRLGRYRLLERVGQGRQADVWRAVDGGSASEPVALKVLPPSAAARDPRRRAQLRREAERGARLSSPSLLPTYEFGEDGGAVFMAMPLVVGCTLAAILDQRRSLRGGRAVPGAHRLATAAEPRYTRDVVGLLARVARAAAEAHDARVAHRDIKPANILVRRDHADGVFLCDFGLGRDLDVATAGQLRDGAGSPLYMAPERLQKLPADEVRSDVFALGITLFEALVLATPVEVPAEMPRHLWASYLSSAEPRRPSALRPSIPPALEATIVTATARDPGDRHPSAARLADDLERFLADEPGARLPRRGA